MGLTWYTPGADTPLETSAEPFATPAVPLPHALHVPFPNKQFPADAAPVPNSFAGTSPEIKSALSQKSLIHVLLRRCLKSGHGIRWQRDWPCHRSARGRQKISRSHI